MSKDPTSTKPPTFPVRQLSVLAYANGFTHWHYKCADQEQFLALTDSHQQQIDNAYPLLCPWPDLMTPGDIIFFSCPTTATTRFLHADNSFRPLA